MVILSCQLNWTWNQPKGTLLVILMRDFHDQGIWFEDQYQISMTRLSEAWRLLSFWLASSCGSQRKGARKGKFLLQSTYICCRWQSHLSCCCWWWWWSDDEDTVLCWYLKSALSESSINWGTATLQRSSRPPVPWELLWHLASKTEELLDSASLQCETDSYGWDAWIISCKSIQ